jgi:hypothetical protein
MDASIRTITLGVCSALLLLVGGCATGTASTNDIATIMQWWNGDYDNDAQIKGLMAADKPVWRADGSGEGGHIAVTSHYRRINLPAFGDNVIYVEETKHNDPDNLFRQRIYTLSQPDSDGPVRVKLWYFKDKEGYIGAWKNLSMLDKLTPEQMSPLPDNCDLLVTRVGRKYHMPMTDGACVFGTRSFNYQVLLGRDSFWFRDKIVDVESGETLETAGAFTYHELARQ